MTDERKTIFVSESGARGDRAMTSAAPLLVVMPTYPPAHSGGGLRIHRQTLRLRSRLDFPVRVLSAAGRGLPPGLAVQDDVPVFRITDRGFLRMFFRMGAFLTGHRPAVIHSAGDTVFNYSAGIWAWLLRIPLIKERTMNSDFLHHWMRRALFQFVHRYAVLCIALNRSIADQFRQAGVDEDRIFCRPNPVDCRVFHQPSSQEKERIRRKMDIDSSVCLHLVVGRFCPRKNQLQAVEALSRLPENHHLLLVGPVLSKDDSQYLDTIRNQISDLDLGARVLLRPESVNSVIDFYHAADSLWIPSVAEGTPNVMLEALCTGIPVLLNQQLNLHDFIVDGENGWHVDFSGEEFSCLNEEGFSRLDSGRIAEDAARAYSAERIDDLYIDRLKQAGLIPERENEEC